MLFRSDAAEARLRGEQFDYENVSATFINLISTLLGNINTSDFVGHSQVRVTGAGNRCHTHVINPISTFLGNTAGLVGHSRATSMSQACHRGHNVTAVTPPCDQPHLNTAGLVGHSRATSMSQRPRPLCLCGAVDDGAGGVTVMSQPCHRGHSSHATCVPVVQSTTALVVIAAFVVFCPIVMLNLLISIVGGQ